MEFIKWLSAPEQNMEFISQTGYLPVTRQAFEVDLQTHLETVEDERIQKMLTAVLSMYEEYRFFTAPNFADFDAISSQYEKDFKGMLTDGFEAQQSGVSISAGDALEAFSK